MIEFRLKIDSRITRMVSPLIRNSFSTTGKVTCPEFPYPEESDVELVDSWQSGLREEIAQDRLALARLLNDARFPHGYVVIEEDQAECILRGLSELRFFIREHRLDSISDDELENGLSLSGLSKDIQSFYLAYLVLAEIQEGLIRSLT